jgi:tubulin polyglutamylase TTLL1
LFGETDLMMWNAYF